MRHDEHYVEALASSAGAPIGRVVPIDSDRSQSESAAPGHGDLSELMASIAEKGIIEPIIVRQRGSRFQIVAGERRYQAAVQVGLRDIPVVIRELDDVEIIEVALIENIQRKDLTPFEGGGSPACARGAVRLHARGHGAQAGEVAHVDYRVALPESDAGGGQKPLSAGRHSLQVVAFTDS
jgi:hypothetical protein